MTPEYQMWKDRYDAECRREHERHIEQMSQLEFIRRSHEIRQESYAGLVAYYTRRIPWWDLAGRIERWLNG